MTPTPTINPTAAKVIVLARKQVGYHEGQDSRGSWDNIQKYSEQVPSLTWSDGQPWCAVFISWLALKADCADLFPCTASVQATYDWYRSRGQLSNNPRVGDQFILNVSEHTGLVIGVTATHIQTIEGNSNSTGSPQGDGVYLLTRPRSDARLTYGHPKYPTVPPAKEPVVPSKPATPSHVGKLKPALVASLKVPAALLEGPDAKGISPKRVAVRATLASLRGVIATARAVANRIPNN